MGKYLSNGLSTLAIISILLSSNAAYAHQGLFSHATIDSSILHFLIHSLMIVSLGITVFFISRWWLKRNTNNPPSKIRIK